MRLPSPSSRLVLPALVVALFAVLLAGRNPSPLVSGAPGPSEPGIAEGSNGGPSVGRTASDDPTVAGETGPPSERPTSGSTSSSTSNPTPRPTVAPTPTLVACVPTDQDQYVYNPDRLEVAAACIRVTGTVEAVRKEADGDLHILLVLDPNYTDLLRPANQGEELGDLVVEPICVRSVTQQDAEAICASDPDPLLPPYPVVGERIWMEGRYVFDLDHGGWAELHPLYRWADI